MPDRVRSSLDITCGTRHLLQVNIRFALLLFIVGLAGHECAKSSPPGRQVTLMRFQCQ